MRRYTIVAALASTGVLLGCRDDSSINPLRTDADGPSFVVSDILHGGARPHFSFLPPIVEVAQATGELDATLEPEVEICARNLDSCAPVVRFTSSGDGSERVHVTGESYHVDWHTNRSSLDPAVDYRIRVLVGGFELGHVDVDVVASARDLRSAHDFGLVIGRTLPIKFRIERGLVAVVAVSPTTASVAPGATQQYTAVLTDLHGAVVTGVAVAWSSGNEAVGTIDQSGLATAVAAGSATITATAATVPGTATLVVEVSNLKTWIGGASGAPTDWANGANWSPAGVPSATEDVLVPSGVANMPVLTRDESIGALTVRPGAHANVAEFTLGVSGNLDAALITAATGKVLLTGDGTSAKGIMPNLDVSGDVQLSGASQATGSLAVLSGGSLNLNGSTLNVAVNVAAFIGDGTTDGLVLQNAADRLEVGRDIGFVGMPTATVGVTGARLSAGTITVGGNFSQWPGNPYLPNLATFISTGTKVAFAGPGNHSVYFGGPAADGNRFKDMASEGADVYFNTDAYFDGQLTTDPNGGGMNNGTGTRLYFKNALPRTNAGYRIENHEVIGHIVLAENVDLGVIANLTIHPGASVTLNGHTLKVAHTVEARIGDGTTDGLVLQNAADRLEVGGEIGFVGMPTATVGVTGARLSAGTIAVGGNFSQWSGNPYLPNLATFISTGTKVAFVGNAANHDVYFSSPGATGNRFYDFENEGTLNFSTSAYAGGSAILRGSVTITGGLTVGLAGNLTLANGLVLTNSGTLNYAGTLTNNGATIIGNSPVDTSP